MLSAVERIRVRAWERVRSGKWPAVLAHVRRHYADICRELCKFDLGQLDRARLPMKSSRPFNFLVMRVRVAQANFSRMELSACGKLRVKRVTHDRHKIHRDDSDLDTTNGC